MHVQVGMAFDPDDLRAKIGEVLPAKGAGPDVAELDDAPPSERK
jgi:hypothetical protein